MKIEPSFGDISQNKNFPLAKQTKTFLLIKHMVRWRQRTIFTSCTHRKSDHLSSLCLSSSNSTLSDSRNPIHYWPHKAVRYQLFRALISALQADHSTTDLCLSGCIHRSRRFRLTAKWYAITSLSFSAIDRHDMLHEALGYHASSSLCLSLNCSFSDSFMSVFSGRSHHLLFPSRS